MAENKKCAHPACSCPPEEGKKYCGQYCQDARDTLADSCHRVSRSEATFIMSRRAAATL